MVSVQLYYKPLGHIEHVSVLRPDKFASVDRPEATDDSEQGWLAAAVGASYKEVRAGNDGETQARHYNVHVGSDYRDLAQRDAAVWTVTHFTCHKHWNMTICFMGLSSAHLFVCLLNLWPSKMFLSLRKESCLAPRLKKHFRQSAIYNSICLVGSSACNIITSAVGKCSVLIGPL